MARPLNHKEKEDKYMLCQNIAGTPEPDILINELKEGTLLTREQEREIQQIIVDKTQIYRQGPGL